MKIIVLHGEDIDKSYGRLRKFIEEAKRRDWEILYDEVSATPSLFGSERLTIIRDYALLTRKVINSFSKIDGTLVIYDEGNLPKTFLQLLQKDVKIEEFKLPKLIWSFLEHLYPGNSEKCVLEFHKIIERDAPEFIFTLIAKQFRDLYWVKTDFASMPYPAWRISKLKAQSGKFGIEKLKKIIDKLAEIDILAKTSKANLVSSLDLLIIKQLE